MRQGSRRRICLASAGRRVKFFDAVRKAASMPKAVSVVVRSDLEELARVYIEH
jgi:hypothetical protein